MIIKCFVIQFENYAWPKSLSDSGAARLPVRVRHPQRDAVRRGQHHRHRMAALRAVERCRRADLGHVHSRNRLLLRPHGGVAVGIEQNLRSRHPGRVGQRRSADMVDTDSASAAPGCTIERSRR